MKQHVSERNNQQIINLKSEDKCIHLNLDREKYLTCCFQILFLEIVVSPQTSYLFTL